MPVHYAEFTVHANARVHARLNPDTVVADVTVVAQVWWNYPMIPGGVSARSANSSNSNNSDKSGKDQACTGSPATGGAAHLGPSSLTCPFHELPNVVMTPHMSGWTEEQEVRKAQQMASNILAVGEGRPPSFIVREPRDQ